MLRVSPGRRTVLLALCATLLSGALAGCGARQETRAPEPPAAETTQPIAADPPAKPPEPKPEPSAKRPDPQLPGTVGVMVENSSMARPQAGLDQADLVYEMESEYGVTRFLALFHQNRVEKIGPVRSARMAFYEVATAYRIPYAHAGGSNEVLLELDRRNTHLLNIDEIYSCGGCFWRSNEREAPHNLYTSTDLLVGRAQAVDWPLQPLPRFAEGEKMADGKAATRIAFHWGPGNQDAAWEWNGKRYERSQSGKPHVMQNGSRVAAENIVVLFTRYVWDGTAQPNSGLNRITVVGSGEGYLFRDGQSWPIRWAKDTRDQHFTFTAADGSPVKFAPGQTWVEILKAKAHVTEGAPQ